MDDSEANYIFAPLDSVDLKSFSAIANKLRSAKKTEERGVGLFLLRLIEYRAKELEGKKTGRPALGQRTGFSTLRDLP